MALRAVVAHLEKHNGLVSRMQNTLNKHLEGHPVSETVNTHLADARDSSVRTEFVQRVGGFGQALIMVIVSIFGGILVGLQIVEMAQ